MSTAPKHKALDEGGTAKLKNSAVARLEGQARNKGEVEFEREASDHKREQM